MIHPTIRHCPACGGSGLNFDGKNRFNCRHCDFIWYQNTATGCGAILTLGTGSERRILLLERGKDPARGMLDYPGGFVDPGESAEAALTREIMEETGLEPSHLTYLCSAANQYEYRGVTYSTCDFVFTGIISEPPRHIQAGEIASFHLLRPEEIVVGDIAFPSLRLAMEQFLRG